MNNFEAANFIKVLADMRKTYEDIIDIVDNERYPQEQRREAREITKNGFFGYVASMMTITSGMFVESDENDDKPGLY